MQFFAQFYQCCAWGDERKNHSRPIGRKCNQIEAKAPQPLRGGVLRIRYYGC
jgi:hypothetical protein